jgi:Domain of unknown function (DUF4216)
VTLESLSGTENASMDSNYDWIDNRRGVRKDQFVYVDFNKLGYQSDPFILAKQVNQVFYIMDPSNKKWHVVLHGRRQIVGVGNVVDEEEYDHFDEISPFSSGIDIMPIDDNQDANYLRIDHEKGVWVERRTSKKSKT